MNQAPYLKTLEILPHLARLARHVGAAVRPRRILL